MAARQKFRGRIAGVGSTSGVRVVVGWWHETPYGSFADAMVERADGHRVLLAPSAQVRDLIAGTYVFDESRIEPIEVSFVPGGGNPRSARSFGAPVASPRSLAPPGCGRGLALSFTSPSLSLALTIGARMPLGRLLRLVPRPLGESPAFATLVNPVARVALRGVRTRGVARAGRREFYGASDVHAVTAMTGRFDGIPLGDLRPVDPPCRFGFSSTPLAPSVTDVVTTIVDS